MPRPRRADAPPRPVDPIVAVLRDTRRACRMTQTDVAEAIGVTQTAVAAWELGINVPDLVSLRRWCALLGLDVKLAGAEEDPADVVYARGWDDCAAAMTAAGRRSVNV